MTGKKLEIISQIVLWYENSFRIDWCLCVCVLSSGVFYILYGVCYLFALQMWVREAAMCPPISNSEGVCTMLITCNISFIWLMLWLHFISWWIFYLWFVCCFIFQMYVDITRSLSLWTIDCNSQHQCRGPQLNCWTTVTISTCNKSYRYWYHLF